jgi:hypothetical protein
MMPEQYWLCLFDIAQEEADKDRDLHLALKYAERILEHCTTDGLRGAAGAILKLATSRLEARAMMEVGHPQCTIQSSGLIETNQDMSQYITGDI